MELSNLKLQSHLPPSLYGLDRERLKAYFENTWKLYECLFSSIINDESYYESPDPLRNPLIFYLGHTAAFYINKMKIVGLIENGVHENWDKLFAVGVDPNLPENLDVSSYWPIVNEVREYRKHIYKIVNQVIEENEISEKITQDHPFWAVMMALEHDRIHFETSSVLIRQLAVEKVQKPELWEYAPSFGIPPKNQWLPVNGGKITFGKAQNSPLFGWDNEFGTFTEDVKPFQATQNLITNHDFLDFVHDNGYQNDRFWTEEGRDWRNRTNTKYPKFWQKINGKFQYRAMFDIMEMPLDWPVEVNAHEAEAYCNWLGDGSRLPDEVEFLLIAREGIEEATEPLFEQKHNLNIHFGSPSPVGFMSEGKSPSGFNDLYGNVWDWLRNDHYPLQGFKTHFLYKEFSEPYMDDEHAMMAGGSWATSGTSASKYYRLWFRRHFFQHAGFRLAKSI